ncbi:MAG: RsmB/NOP family class I SAM-dependent RNA methyltransferase [Deltaproteobacteria bacterium]|jgi:16S rRNA (cytosine1407-C5)-methyltransferase|nr:RsmB/NOP family class I SAM-dependent RNA methyltransferase [Deltaproteobacteria bacterium]
MHKINSAKEKLFVERLSKIFYLPQDKIYQNFSSKKRFSGRVNTLKISADEFYSLAEKENLKLTPLDWYPDGFYFSSPKSEIAQHRLFKLGLGFIQNASSFLPVLGLKPAKGEKILDVCASPGAKASHIAALTQNDIFLWVNDGISSRLKEIEEVRNLLGFKYDVITSFPGQYIDKFINEKFNKILVDAQCTGEAMIDLLKANSLHYWNLQRIKKYHYLQLKILKNSFKLLKPGGVLVYSTCSFAPEENEAVISEFLRDTNDVIVDSLIFDTTATREGIINFDKMTYDKRVQNALRIFPEEYLVVFFVCRLRKVDSNNKTGCVVNISPGEVD